VEVAANLKFVKIWVVCTPADLMGIAFGKLRQKVSHLKFLLGQKLDWQFVPALQFRVDHSYLAVEEVERLIEEIHNEKKKTVRRRKKV
jgi:ribosome-binding factor A